MILIKKVSLVFTVIAALVVFYQLANPTEIAGSHRYYDSYIVLVKKFPVTAYGRTWWWNKHRERLLKQASVAGRPLSIRINHIGNGYLTQEDADSDAYCFDEIKTAYKCVNKYFLMDIIRRSSGEPELHSIDYFYIDRDMRDGIIMFIVSIYAMAFILPVSVIAILLFYARKNLKNLKGIIFFSLAMFVASPYWFFLYFITFDPGGF